MNPQRTGNWSFSVHRWGQEFLIHTHIYPRKLLYQIKPWPLVFGTILCNGPTSWFLMGRAAKAVMSNKFLASHPPSRNDGRLLDEYGAWGTSKYVRPTCPTSMHTYTYIYYIERERVQCVYIYMCMIYYTTICTYIINLLLPILPTKHLPICGAELLIPVSSSISRAMAPPKSPFPSSIPAGRAMYCGCTVQTLSIPGSLWGAQLLLVTVMWGHVHFTAWSKGKSTGNPGI